MGCVDDEFESPEVGLPITVEGPIYQNSEQN
jgi:hypothetical protein